MLIRRVIIALALLAGMAGPAAYAETIDVAVRRPAVAGEAFLLRSFSVERFSGTDGRALAAALERALANARSPDGRPLFEIFDVGGGQGIISGGADFDVEEGRYSEKRRFCPGTRDRNAKCDDNVKEEVEVLCRTRVATLNADMRIVRARDGRVIASRGLPQRAEARWCPGDSLPPELQSVASRFVARAADEAMADLIPYAQVLPIRIREDRRGLAKDIGAQFKAAVLATRGDGRDGCQMFEALEPVAGGHIPLIFNLALCAEARADYARAVDGYRRAGDRDAGLAADRALASQAAVVQAREREGGRR